MNAISLSLSRLSSAKTSSEKRFPKGGMAPVFVDEAKKAVWTIDNPDAVKEFYGDHVTVTATADQAKKSVHIESIAELK